MFPLRDHNPSGATPYVTWALIAINCVVYVMTADWGLDMRDFWLRNALFPGAVRHGEMLHGLVSHMFLHGGILHLAGNMLFLWVFGVNLEEQLGHVLFAAFYLACGLVAALAYVLSDPGSMVPMVGASGAIAGVMGGYVLLFPRARIDVMFYFVLLYKIWPVPAWVVLGLWFALQVGSEIIAGTSGGVAHMAHIGGFVAGLALCIPLWLVLGGPRFWSRTHGHPPHPASRFGQSQIPVVRRDR